MIAFLTSSPGGIRLEDGEMKACALDESNGFVEKLKSHWKGTFRCLLLSSDPEDTEGNDQVAEMMGQAFAMTGLGVSEFAVCDRRRSQISREELHAYDLLILAGGHVPTEHAFYEELELREKIKGYPGMILGISAGTMNSAALVYAQPELPGESLDQNDQRFLPGLGLTEVMILPHYQEIKHHTLDGKRVMEDITYPDSMGRRFYALVDGSYLYIENGRERIFGEAYAIENGSIRKICGQGEEYTL